VLTIAGFNLTRFIDAILLRDFLAEFPTIPVLYLTLSGLFWGVMAIPLVWGLWSGRGWAPRYTIVYALIYSVYFWTDHLITERRVSESNSPFLIGANLLLLMIIWWILSRRKARAFFGEQHE
jgi:hypothetical protein